MDRRAVASVSSGLGADSRRLQRAFAHFRESRLYVQVVCTAALVVVGWLAHLLPDGPWRRVGDGLEWVVTAEYDFAGQARRAGEWAVARGGWTEAGAELWHEGVTAARRGLGLGALEAPGADARSAGNITDAGGSVPAADAPAPSSGPAAPAALPPLLPVEGSVLWGYGWLPAGVGESFHQGIDFLAPVGTPVVAVLDGTVVAVLPAADHGQVVEVRHGSVIASYAQVEDVRVHAGDEVARGQVLAAVARARGAEESLPPHLHFALRPAQSGEPFDPAPYLGLGGKEP